MPISERIKDIGLNKIDIGIDNERVSSDDNNRDHPRVSRLLREHIIMDFNHSKRK